MLGAAELKYTREIKLILTNQLVSPSDDFVRFFTSQVYSGRITQNVLEQFQGITKRAMKRFISEEIGKRLKSVLDKDGNQSEAKSEAAPDDGLPNISDAMSPKQKDDDRIETTPEEVEGFVTVRDILKYTVKESRIFYRDTISYFGILLDDNNRKPVCRLYFNTSQKYIALLDSDERKEEKIPIEEVSEIGKFADRLRNTVLRYEED